jgi:hypothetical protein
MMMVIIITTINYCMLHKLLIDKSCNSTYLRNVEFSKCITLNNLHKSENRLVLVLVIVASSSLSLLLSLVTGFVPSTSLEPAVTPTAQASNFTLQYFPYYV